MLPEPRSPGHGIDRTRTMGASAAARWYMLLLLTGACFFAYIDRTALAMLLQPIKKELGLTDTELGLLSGPAFAIFYAVMGIPLARLADRTSRVRLISVCLALWSVMTAVSGVARTFPQMFLARIGVGVGEAGCVPPSHSLIGDLFPRERRSLAIAIFQTGAALGGAGGLFVVGLLADRLSWRAALQIIGLSGLPLALLIILSGREPARPAMPGTGGEGAFAAIDAMRRRPALVHLVFGYALSAICHSGAAQWIPSFFVRSYGLSLSQIGFWYGLGSGLGAVLGLVGGGWLASRLVVRDVRWELRLPTIAFALYVPVFGAIFVVHPVAAALVLTGLSYVLSGFGGGIALAAIQSFVEPHRRATAVSVTFLFSSFLGLGLGPYLIGVVSDLLAPSLGGESLRYALLITCVVALWATLHLALAERRMVGDIIK